MKKIIFILLLGLFMAGCASTTSPAVNLGTSCDNLQPTAGDIQYALNFGSKLFTNEVWQRSYTVQELDVIVSWTHRGVAALSDVSVLMFCNENGTDDLNLFYNNQIIKENFVNYDAAEITASCARDGIMLYELDAVEEGSNYKIHQWIQPLSKTRLLSVIIVFPKEDNVLVDRYSQEFFPTLPSCE
jgi:uncharacterized protein YqkB